MARQNGKVQRAHRAVAGKNRVAVEGVVDDVATRNTEEIAKARSMLVRCARLFRCLMKYNPTQRAIAHIPFRTALRAGKNIQRPAKSAGVRCAYSNHKRKDTARPLSTTIAPSAGRGLISACSMPTIKS